MMFSKKPLLKNMKFSGLYSSASNPLIEVNFVYNTKPPDQAAYASQ
jgi:hypothetical protein